MIDYRTAAPRMIAQANEMLTEVRAEAANYEPAAPWLRFACVPCYHDLETETDPIMREVYQANNAAYEKAKAAGAILEQAHILENLASYEAEYALSLIHI